MKVCVSSTGKDKSSLMDGRFGRCRCFAIYDTDNKEYKFVENDGINSAHGAGIAAAQRVIDEKAEVVLTGKMGPNAMELIKASNIKILEVDGGTVENAVKSFLEQKLGEIDKPGPAHFGMRG